MTKPETTRLKVRRTLQGSAAAGAGGAVFQFLTFF